MMRLWKLLLRLTGLFIALVELIGLINTVPLTLQRPATLPGIYSLAHNALIGIGLALLCFAAASALGALEQVDQRIMRATASRRRPMPRSSDEQPGAEFTAVHSHREPHYATDESGRPYLVNAKAPVAPPAVREAPPPIRITPGTEDQYIDTPRPRAAAAAPPARVPLRPHEKGVDRELLRQARDMQIRERQAAQQRKRPR